MNHSRAMLRVGLSSFILHQPVTVLHPGDPMNRGAKIEVVALSSASGIYQNPQGVSPQAPHMNISLQNIYKQGWLLSQIKFYGLRASLLDFHHHYYAKKMTSGSVYTRAYFSGHRLYWYVSGREIFASVHWYVVKWAVKDKINFLLKVKRPVESDAIEAFLICHSGLFGSFTLAVDCTKQHSLGKLENVPMYTNARIVQTVYENP